MVWFGLYWSELESRGEVLQLVYNAAVKEEEYVMME